MIIDHVFDMDYFEQLKIKNPWERTPKSKKKFQRIVDIAKELFFEMGNGMSMRELARRLDVGISYIYRYVQNKRELWFAILYQEFVSFADHLEKVLDRQTYTAIEMIQEFARELFRLCSDEFQRYNLMFLMEPPKSDKPTGPFEQWQNPRMPKMLGKIILEAVEERDIKLGNPILFGIKISNLLFGTAINTSQILDYFEVMDPYPVNKKEIQEYIIRSIPSLFNDESY